MESKVPLIYSLESLVLNINSKKFKDAVSRIPKSYQSFELDELELRINLTSKDLALKSRFWKTLFEHKSDKKINPSIFYEGICSSTHWYNNILSSPVKLYWLILPIYKIEEIAPIIGSSLFSSIRKILQLSCLDENGNLIESVASAQIKLFEIISKNLEGKAVI